MVYSHTVINNSVEGTTPDGRVTAGNARIPTPTVVPAMRAVFPKTLPG